MGVRPTCGQFNGGFGVKESRRWEKKGDEEKTLPKKMPRSESFLNKFKSQESSFCTNSTVSDPQTVSNPQTSRSVVVGTSVESTENLGNFQRAC